MISLPKWLKEDFRHTFFGEETLVFDHVMSVPGYGWLVDNIVNFYFLYLAKQKFLNSKYLFIPPPLLMVVNYMSEEDITSNLDPLGISKKEVIFIPINDGESTNNVSGRHWSLVVYVRKDNTYYYYDSMGNLNESIGKKYARKFDKYIKPPKTNHILPFKVVSCQQQTNSCDCGVFLLAFAVLVGEGKKVEEGIDPRKFREHILQLIKYFSKK